MSSPPATMESISTPPISTIEEQNKLMCTTKSQCCPPPTLDICCSPQNYSEYQRRLSSFTCGTWFDKPAAISPIECSRVGFTNTRIDTICCETCGETFQWTKDASYYLDIEDIQLIHHAFCPWRCVAVSLECIGVAGDAIKPHSLIQNYILRLQKLESAFNESPVLRLSAFNHLFPPPPSTFPPPPPKRESFNITVPLPSIHAPSLLPLLSDASGTLELLKLLSFFGWTYAGDTFNTVGETTQLLQCDYCLRRISTHSFSRITFGCMHVSVDSPDATKIHLSAIGGRDTNTLTPCSSTSSSLLPSNSSATTIRDSDGIPQIIKPSKEGGFMRRKLQPNKPMNERNKSTLKIHERSIMKRKNEKPQQSKLQFTSTSNQMWFDAFERSAAKRTDSISSDFSFEDSTTNTLPAASQRSSDETISSNTSVDVLSYETVCCILEQLSEYTSNTTNCNDGPSVVEVTQTLHGNRGAMTVDGCMLDDEVLKFDVLMASSHLHSVKLLDPIRAHRFYCPYTSLDSYNSKPLISMLADAFILQQSGRITSM